MADAAQNGHIGPSRPGSGPSARSSARPEDKARIYQLVRHLIDDLALLFRKELALAGAEVSHTLSDTKRGLSSLLSGVLVLNSGYLFLLAAVTLGLAEIMALWLAALIVGGVVTVIGLVMVTAEKKKLEPSSPKPARTLDGVSKDKESVREPAL